MTEPMIPLSCRGCGGKMINNEYCENECGYVEDYMGDEE